MDTPSSPPGYGKRYVSDGTHPMLEYLFGPRNPTRSWPVGLDQAITFDLDDASVNGVRLGQTLDGLSFLGPDEGGSSYRNGQLLYFAKGLGIRFSPKSQSIVEYRIVQSDPLDQRFQPFGGTLLVNGRPLNPAALTPDRVIEEYGDCYWQDNDQDECILFFEFVGLEWQLEFDLATHLRCITVTNEPIMSSEDQRLAYGVTQPWPPRSK